MSNSIQTNVNSLHAQENLRVNNEFQSRTIERLTSGYRINSSSDDAAGLAVANKFRSDVSELTQGVRNANDGISQLQIIDGGLNNVSKMLDRLKTLATQAASGTFTGDRNTLNTEYDTLLSEIDRQASNAGLATGTTGGRFNKDISVYIGGGDQQSNASVSIDMSGAANRVDSAALGLRGTRINGGNGITVGDGDISSGTVMQTTASQSYTFTIAGEASAITATVAAGGRELTGQQVVDEFNTQLSGYGITASLNDDGALQFASDKSFVLLSSAHAGTAITATDILPTDVMLNTAKYNTSFTLAPPTVGGVLSFKLGGKEVASVTVADGATEATTLADLKNKLQGSGIDLLETGVATDAIVLQSNNQFTIEYTGGDAVLTSMNEGSTDLETGGTSTSVAAAEGDSLANAKNAITALDKAVTALGLVQGKVGTAQNKLQYAMSLANSQIASFSAAESRIRDADIANEAANLTKAQLLQQSSIAALAQANQAPQAILSLLKG